MYILNNLVMCLFSNSLNVCGILILMRGNTLKRSMSVEEMRAMKIMESSVTHEDGRYKLGLPWRDEDASLPNNMPLGHARLQQLKRKLSRDATLRQMYTATVNDFIEKGYAKEVTHIDTNSKRVWY